MLLDQLRAMVDTVPPGGSVTLPRDWLATQLEASSVQTSAGPGDDLTVPQLATRFGRACSTIRGWLEADRFPGAYRLNDREWRVPPVAIQAFVVHERQRGARPGRPSIGDWRGVPQGAKVEPAPSSEST